MPKGSGSQPHGGVPALGLKAGPSATKKIKFHKPGQSLHCLNVTFMCDMQASIK